MAVLTDRLDYVLGKKAAGPLEEYFGIRTVNDLLRHYPRKYSDGMTVRGEGEDLEEGEHVTFVDVIAKAEVKWTNRPPKREYLVVTLANRRPKVTATFFNAKFLKKGLVEGTRLMLSGEVGYFKGTMQLTHPAFLVLESPSGRSFGTKSLKTIAATSGATGDELLSVFERDFFPIYPANKKVQSWDIYACVRQVLDVLDPIDEPLPKSVLQQRNLITEDEALRAIHLAENTAERERAQARLTFDEAVGLQWALVGRRYGELSESGPVASSENDGLLTAMRKQLPFELTDGQREVLDVVSAELAASRPMNRMLQGEVGSGKTIVSVLAMLQMIDAGYQCALLAPTEVLAAQHARSIRDVLGPLAMAGQLGGADRATRVALLTGSMSPQQKREVRDEVVSGDAGIVVGTHALLQEAVEFHRLGMVVVDEQHRFGVEQRDRLRAKAPDGLTPHLLVMTATPIPRTVALTVYGDLETSTLRELPRGRQPITTNTIFVKEKPAWLQRAWQRIIEEVGAGRQAYVVASRIDESDTPAKDRAWSACHDGGDALRTTAPRAALRIAPRPDARPVAQRREGRGDGGIPSGRDRCPGVHHRHRGRRGRAERDGDGGGGCRSIRHQPAAPASGTHRPRPASQPVPTGHPATRGIQGGATPAGRRRHTGRIQTRRPRSEGTQRRRCVGAQPIRRPITLRFLSLAEHLDIIVAAREFCEELYEKDPAHPGMAVLAAQFTDTDRVEYLDKA